MTTRHMTRLLAPLSLAVMVLSGMPAHAQQKLQIAGNFASEHPSSVAVEQVFRPRSPS
ncbi:MAG: hypothetical protein ABIQ60_16585 [Burkholderiaceae bacterium]